MSATHLPSPLFFLPKKLQFWFHNLGAVAFERIVEPLYDLGRFQHSSNFFDDGGDTGHGTIGDAGIETETKLLCLDL